MVKNFAICFSKKLVSPRIKIINYLEIPPRVIKGFFNYMVRSEKCSAPYKIIVDIFDLDMVKFYLRKMLKIR